MAGGKGTLAGPVLGAVLFTVLPEVLRAATSWQWQMLLYGVLLIATLFFMPRGIKLLGWVFIVFGCLLAGFLAGRSTAPPPRFAHAIMCLLFGGLHMAYGVYLRFTEQRKNEA